MPKSFKPRLAPITLKSDGEHVQNRSNISNIRALYATDKIQIQGIQTFGWQHAKYNDESLPLHYHRDCFEFHYLLQGSLNFVVEDRTYSMKAGDVFVTFPNELHQTGDQTIIRKMYWFSIKENSPLLDLPPCRSQYLMDGLHGLKNRVIPVGNEMSGILKEVYHHITLPEEGHRLYASAQMASFLYKLIEYDRIWMEERVSNEISRALEFIEQNRHRNISLEEVAQHCHLSVSHFKHRFKNETGSTPSFFIQKQRIECAKELLKAGYSVTSTAHELDFASSNYFSVVFRRVTSMTPTQYIKNLNQ